MHPLKNSSFNLSPSKSGKMSPTSKKLKAAGVLGGGGSIKTSTSSSSIAESKATPNKAGVQMQNRQPVAGGDGKHAEGTEHIPSWSGERHWLCREHDIASAGHVTSA